MSAGELRRALIALYGVTDVPVGPHEYAAAENAVEIAAEREGGEGAEIPAPVRRWMAARHVVKAYKTPRFLHDQTEAGVHFRARIGQAIAAYEADERAMFLGWLEELAADAHHQVAE